jgi:hypothetical protein
MKNYPFFTFFLHSKYIIVKSAVLVLLLVGCTPKAVVNLLMPKPPAYPDFENKATVIAEAQSISDGLEKHIFNWLDGKAPAQLPEALLPKGMDVADGPYFLTAAKDIDPKKQWFIRPAEYELDHKALRGYYPDPHCTYIVPGNVILPFGHKLVVEGQFPHSRFFDIQMSPPLDPSFYYYAKMFGQHEVPIVDADIEPLPGHTNPFLPSANRNATKRSYKVTFEMRIGNGHEIEPAYREPLHRRSGNSRFASAIQYQGPFAYEQIIGGHRRGKWDDGSLWIRYYAPDKNKDVLGGVPLPRITYQTPDGRNYYILSSNLQKKSDPINQTHAARSGKASHPDNVLTNKEFGWLRDLDIFHGGIAAIYAGVGKTSPEEKAEGRALVKGIAAKGADLPPPGNAMSSNSRVPFISYLSRGLSLQNGYVAVITGTLPTFPKTLSGQAKMSKGQFRYLSFTMYPDPDFMATRDIGTPHASVMDEELNLDNKDQYTIVYSRPADRPANWNVPQVNWQNWGPAGAGGIVIRWLSVGPDWRDARIVPDAENISYKAASWLSATWDQDLVGRNNRKGLLGKHQPIVHYMKKETFEKIGTTLKDRDTPYWEE